MFNRRFISLCMGLHCAFLATHASAGISLSATRLVFDGEHKEVSIKVRNNGDDLLIQSWIDSDSNVGSAPFAVTPPLAKILGKQQQLLRVIYEGTGMPADKESVVWLNVQEIPQTSTTKNTLQLAVRQRIKVFFRPAGLTAKAYLAPTQLMWQVAEQNGHAILQVTNPGLYHVSLAELTLKSGVITEQPFDSTMIAPGQHKNFPLEKLNSSHPIKLDFLSINDYGAQDRYVADLSRGTAVSATAKH
ncbi:fimbrial chaperone [Pseudomonas sp. FW306-02-F02-AA]|uniref:Pilus assembly protein n=1 Tax=Pseudomonas fluorescens TaxID=294 RepID=A0A0N9VWR0_PSEFL|nr:MULTISPECIES: molecular chaperone [Pseudomonas]ALI02907.1 pilus assembly protein [Pseudomonas fluorescens]PMZ04341.1 fimbrial chaperone [Pseudomonas sp. FW306-02-F02-AB]PMZ10576.1 fimbrial chaperone [Pseudomonas sp. FW306-02-H06C]PMZ15970.1 fimbrial chaperone [Pseudomonas sp. FW306-02-F02-AA]PMZ21898.1 fimbrial chaperone [Pseudomonas sp. FW306-02-F08-AA]